jgi:hypothetical protein
VAQGIDPEFKLEQQQQQQKPKPKPNKKTDLNLFIYLFLFFSTGQCGLNAQPHTYKASTLPLEPCPQPRKKDLNGHSLALSHHVMPSAIVMTQPEGP